MFFEEVDSSTNGKGSVSYRLDSSLIRRITLEAQQRGMTKTDVVSTRLKASYKSDSEIENVLKLFRPSEYADIIQLEEDEEEKRFHTRIDRARDIMRSNSTIKKRRYLDKLRTWAANTSDAEHQALYTHLVDQFEKDLSYGQ
jgi:hypothetical protein